MAFGEPQRLFGILCFFCFLQETIDIFLNALADELLLRRLLHRGAERDVPEQWPRREPLPRVRIHHRSAHESRVDVATVLLPLPNGVSRAGASVRSGFMRIFKSTFRRIHALNMNSRYWKLKSEFFPDVNWRPSIFAAGPTSRGIPTFFFFNEPEFE